MVSPHLVQLGVLSKDGEGHGSDGRVVEVEGDARGRSSDEVPLVLAQRQDLLLHSGLVDVTNPGGEADLVVA